MDLRAEIKQSLESARKYDSEGEQTLRSMVLTKHEIVTDRVEPLDNSTTERFERIEGQINHNTAVTESLPTNFDKLGQRIDGLHKHQQELESQ